MTDCIFCKIVSGDIPSIKIYENDSVYAFADIHPVNLGHTLVVPKKHYENLYSTPDLELSEMISVAKKIANAAKEILPADGINIEMNNDGAAGQIVFHSHIHVIPRKNDDGFRHWKGPERTPEEIQGAAEKIRATLG